MNANLCELFRDRAAKNPGRAALIHRGVSVTYGELMRRVERRATALARHGVEKGDRVVIFVPMSIPLARRRSVSSLFVKVVAQLYLGMRAAT